MVRLNVRDGEYHMGSRLPILRRGAELVARADDECVSGNNSAQCEMPVTSASLRIPIAIGVTVPVVALVVMLIWLHRKNVRKMRMEDANDPHKSLDFGLGAVPSDKGNKRKVFGGEKLSVAPHNRQISMDMNLSSPYLLPPGANGSQESLRSLAKSLNPNEDPYRHINKFGGSDAGSLRSYKAPQEPRIVPRPQIEVTASRKASLNATTSPTSTIRSIPPRYEASQAEHIAAPPPAAFKDSSLDQSPVDNTPYPNEKSGSNDVSMPAVPEVQEPKPAALARAGPSPPPTLAALPASAPLSISEPVNDYKSFNFSQEPYSPPPTEPLPELPPQASIPTINAPAPLNLSPNSSQRQPLPDAPFSAPLNQDDQYIEMNSSAHNQHQEEDRGRSQHRRQSSEYPIDAPISGLVIPQNESKRLSVGFRPLPPDEVIESEDPETRANRIRSFYKEYFDDSKHDPMPPIQPSYNTHGEHHNNHQGTQYYEDYDQSYLNEAAYYDPDTNQFVMPYAQPVARRAMTPPPSGSRRPMPRGPGQRPHAGSIGGMSAPGGPRGPHRPGSAASSSRFGPSPRPGSSASGQYGRSRAGSAMSAARKNLPPPAALTTLPNPSKLRDDSFALMAATDFAPPTNFKDQAAGRSQSPAGGERRAYQAHAVHSPLVSAFDEMAALPSPHVLRKSSTFTGLDFAPPRKFKDADTMSDAGSIRSNRSGISAVQLGAIRSGAGRVSRLPGDQVFTTAALADTLKPQWGMRP